MIVQAATLFFSKVLRNMFKPFMQICNTFFSIFLFHLYFFVCNAKISFLPFFCVANIFPTQVSSSCFFDPEISIPKMSSAAGIASTYSDSSISTTSSDSLSSTSTVVCYFDPSTSQRQNFSIPEKILYYMAKNCTNAETFQKLVETCKYFFKINPVINVYRLVCDYDKWYAYYDENRDGVRFKYDQPINGKIWITKRFAYAPQLIPLIYKNDAKVVYLQSKPIKLEEFLYVVGNAKELTMFRQLVKYENGEIVQFEDIVQNLPKVQSFTFSPYFDGSNVNCNTVRKLMEIQHFKHLTKLTLYSVSEVIDVEEMFYLILENKHIEVELWYRREISVAYKELVQQYSIRLQNEEGCNSRIGFDDMFYNNLNELLTSSSEDNSSDTSFNTIEDGNLSDVDENEDLMLPWKNEENEEWELPWDKE